MNDERATDTPAIDLEVNGRHEAFPGPLSIAELVRHLAVAGRYAVEVNGEIVPRSEHVSYRLTAGDVVEVVQAIGGG